MSIFMNQTVPLHWGDVDLDRVIDNEVDFSDMLFAVETADGPCESGKQLLIGLLKRMRQRIQEAESR